MEELLGRLVLRRTGVMIAATSFAALGFAGGFGYHRLHREDPCRVAETQIAEFSNEVERANIQAALDVHWQHDAEGASARFAKQLDQYISSWGDTYRHACRAALVLQEQTTDEFARTTKCLARARTRVLSFVTESAKITNVHQAERALSGVYGINSPTTCRDDRSQSEDLQIPERGPARVQLEALIERMDKLHGMMFAGRYAVKHGAALASGELVDEADLPDEVLAPAPTRPKATASLQSLADVEREHILRVLDACEGCQAEAARVLGIARNTLWRKLRDYGSA